MNRSTTLEAMNETGGQLGSKACEAMQNAQASVGEWTQKAQDDLETLRKTASGYAEQGQRKAQELGRTLSGFVRERPVAALLTAVGLGYVIGILLKRR